MIPSNRLHHPTCRSAAYRKAAWAGTTAKQALIVSLIFEAFIKPVFGDCGFITLPIKRRYLLSSDYFVCLPNKEPLSVHFWSILIQTLIGSMISLYVGLCIGYWIFHRFFVLFPSKKITHVPSDYGMDYEEVFFQTSDHVRLQGWWLSPQHPVMRINNKNATLVFFPGNKGTLSKFLPGLLHLVSSGYTVFVFSYRGFGKSALRWPTEHGVYQDSLAAVEYVLQTKQCDPKHLILYGQSLGCAMASKTAQHIHPAVLILEAGFTSMPDLVKQFIPWLPVHYLTTARFDTRHHLAHVHSPVIIAHSTEDKAVPPSQRDNLFNAAPEPKQKLTVYGLHAQGLEVNYKPYLESIRQFLEQTI
ncbi:MAG: alpha/beta fold hydrolase [Elusimicrobia bacterium]|nr:alpha/beta fold hydrolase [Elusimicrobiota bacterium]MBD3412489.1 alpha/beta fold hydrolase [Elusimicrobiota bacterium]